MPGFDGTGPMGAGPMTGGARGFCNPAAAGYGGWSARSFGYGPTYGSPYVNPYGTRPEDELQVLREEAEAIKRDLEGINKRMQELESRSSPS
jgi:hypothetical protein